MNYIYENQQRTKTKVRKPSCEHVDGAFLRYRVETKLEAQPTEPVSLT